MSPRRLALCLAFLVLLTVELIGTLACSNDEQEQPAVSCPVPGDACRLANQYLQAVREADGNAIVETAAKQQFGCPASAPAVDDSIAAAYWMACRNTPGADIEAYEYQNGKAPFYYTDRDDFARTVAEAIHSLDEGHPDRFKVVAVGCGATDPEAAPDCDRITGAFYGIEGSDGRLFLALIFKRGATADEWRIDKVWSPFPSLTPSPLTDGTRVEIFTRTGARLLQIYNYVE